MKYFTLLFLLFSGIAFSQQKLISDFENQLKTENSTEKKLILRAKIANAKRFLQTEQSVKDAKLIINEAKKLEDKSTLCEVYTIVYKIFYKAKKYPEMISCADEALTISKSLTSKELKGKALLAKARVLTNINEGAKATEYLQNAYQMLQNSNSYSELRETTYFLSGIYGEKQDLKKQKKYALLSYDYAQKSGQAEDIVIVHQIMGSLYYEIFKKNKNKEDYKTAVEYYEKGISYFYKHQDEIVSKTNLPIMYFNQAELWYQEEKETKKKDIVNNILLAKKYGIEVKEKDIVFEANSLLSAIYMDEKNYFEAEKLLTEAINHYENENPKSFYSLYNLYEIRADLYSKINKHELANTDLQKTLEYYKQLTDEKQLEAANLLEAKFDAKNKEERIVFLEEKNHKQLLFNILLVVLILLLLGGFYLLYRNYRIKMKLKEETLLKKDLEKQKMKAEQEVAFLKTEQMQKELIANSLQIERKNEVLQSVKNKILEAKIDEKSKQKIHILLNEEFRLDKDFDQLKTELSNIHPLFFEKLKEKSTQKLSDLDLKYSGAIYLGMSTKQIAQIFQVEPESVRMSKYRIKQKLGLGKEEDLGNYLKRIG